MTNSVYTAIFGGYDKVRTPPVVNQLWDYVLFSDLDNTEIPRPWINSHIQSNLSNQRKSRRYKILSHESLPDAKITIWHGGNIVLNVDPDKILEMFDSDIMVFSHPHRNCLYKESDICKSWKLDDKETIDAQMKRYAAEGMPQNYGLAACWFVMRRNTEAVREFNNLWWAEVEKGSVRDQLSFDYVRWKTGIRVQYLDGDLINHPWFRRFNHK